MENKKDYTIQQEQLQAILDYLVTRPFAEVYQLVNLIQSLEKKDKPTK